MRLPVTQEITGSNPVRTASDTDLPTREALKLREDGEFAKAFSIRESTKFKAAHAAGKIKYDTFTGRKHREETKQKMRESKRLRDLQRFNVSVS